ncbi:esterase family protein [Bacillus sp. E214]|uniref:alpha/beta hydrolase n=1 Tax=Bacillus sp. E214 TaxID=2587156 RepID=UPI0011DFB3A7|nr:alpha/beta hydrolase-fold protein [Bacillus sp. E214]
MALKAGTIKGISFNSKELNEEIELLVYLPSAFSHLYKYSVLIAQDGKDYFQLGKIGRAADELLERQEIDNIIIIGVPYKNVEDRWNKYHPDGLKHTAYKRFLAHELVPYIDAEYPTYQMGLSRALIGDSLAATVSLMAAMDYPNTFGKIALHSPLVNESVLSAVESFQFPHLTQIYHTIGKNETTVQTSKDGIIDFVQPNQELNSIIESKGFPVFYEEIDGDHTWRAWQSDMKRTLTWLFHRT